MKMKTKHAFPFHWGLALCLLFLSLVMSKGLVWAQAPMSDTSVTTSLDEDMSQDCSPYIYFDYVPPFGSSANLTGHVECVNPADYKVAVYIYYSGWYTKPYYNAPLTNINPDSTWTCDITTGGNDTQASKIAAFLVPTGYNPPIMSGGAPLPDTLFDNALDYVHVERTARTLTFADREWHVKASTYLEGPGPNYFSDSTNDVWVDADGRLHLKIAYHDNRWYSTEVFTTEPLGYGDYVFKLSSPVDQLNENVVFGLFTWDSVAPSDQHSREIDVEFSRWGNPGNPNNAEYVVQPWDTPGNQHEFSMALAGTDSTHLFKWRENQIEFASYDGHTPTPGAEIEFWTYTGSDVPLEDDGNARINLWLFNGTPPSDGQEVEIIVEAFAYTPPNVEPVVSIDYVYWLASGGGSGVGRFDLLPDGTFVDAEGRTGRWGPGQGRLFLTYDPGQFCDAFLIGNNVFPNQYQGPIFCRDGSGIWGFWFGTLPDSLDALPSMSGVPALDFSLTQ